MTMTDLMKVLIPSAVTLAIALIGGLLQYRKWRLERERSRREDFQKSRKSACEGLWKSVEGAHVQIRSEEITPDKFRTLIREVNSYILENDIYLDGDVRVLANEYLKSVYHLRERLKEDKEANEARKSIESDSYSKESDISERREEVLDSFDDTCIFMTNDALPDRIRVAREKTNHFRSKLLDRIRQAIQE
jgi:hypothetical protein